MVGYAMIFGVLALFAAAFGFGGIGESLTDTAQVFFAICLIMVFILLLAAQVKRSKS